MQDDLSVKKAYSSLHATWFSVLQVAVKCMSKGQISKEQWVGALAAAMESNEIECVPGSYRSLITCRRVIKLTGRAPVVMAVWARPGSLKRAAIEAEERRSRPTVTMRIDFGCPVPFMHIPSLVRDGFEMQARILNRGNTRVAEHFQLAQNCLVECLGDPLCDLLLMIVLTVAASSVTPEVPPKSRGFTAAAKKKEPGLVAANLVTRMLWFLRPNKFPWKDDSGKVLHVPEMTKKIGEDDAQII
jgi:hypothetical protein